MGDVIERTIRAGALPPELCGTLREDAMVRVTVRALTGSGFAGAFEKSVSQPTAEAEGDPFPASGRGHRRTLAHGQR